MDLNQRVTRRPLPFYRVFLDSGSIKPFRPHWTMGGRDFDTLSALGRACAAFKYMDDLEELWDPMRPSRDANGQLVHDLFPRPDEVGRSIATRVFNTDSGDHVHIELPTERKTDVDKTRSGLVQSIAFQTNIRRVSNNSMNAQMDVMQLTAPKLVSGMAYSSPNPNVGDRSPFLLDKNNFMASTVARAGLNQTTGLTNTRMLEQI